MKGCARVLTDLHRRLLLLPVGALALLAHVDALAENGPEPLAARNLLHLTLSLAAVVAAIALLAWLMRRMQRLQGGSSANMRVVGSLGLGPRERILLIEAGETQLLVGVSAAGIQSLHVFDTPLDTPPARTFERALAAVEAKR